MHALLYTSVKNRSLNTLLVKTGTEFQITEEGQIAIIPGNVLIQRRGTIKGQLLDGETRTPILGTNVVIGGSRRGASGDASGILIIPSLKVGCYEAQCPYIRYRPVRVMDIIVWSDRIDHLNRVWPICLRSIFHALIIY